MTIYQLLLRNIKKNLRHYYLYFFALVCSIALYFAFVTLQYEAVVGKLGESFKVQAGIEVASYMLVFIVAVFLLYANGLFLKRRTKEIGLYQLAGMTKRQVSLLFLIENAALYAGSLLAGIFTGFIGSKLLMMTLYKLLGIEQVATLQFSWQAVIQTIIVIVILYALLMIMTSLQIRRYTLLALFRQQSKTESGQRIRWFQVVIGIVGLFFIASGYYTSTTLFDGNTENSTALTRKMGYTLASTIIGTYFFYKGSVTLLFLLIRKSKQGYLTIQQVMSMGSIMFRMRTNAFLLTVITTVTALAIGFLSLGYIAYYSSGKEADASTGGADFYFASEDDQEKFQKKLGESEIDYEQTKKEIAQIKGNIADTLSKDSTLSPEQEVTFISSDQADIAVKAGHVIFVKDDDYAHTSFQAGTLAVHASDRNRSYQLDDIVKRSIVPSIVTLGGPAAVLSPADFEKVHNDKAAKQQTLHFTTLKDREDEEKAANLFISLKPDEIAVSKKASSEISRIAMGLYMFIVGFLGLAFLLTSGCILYIKQMDEGDSERPTYSVLRKLGFTEADLRKGVIQKQLFHFGIPIAIGLSHSYFAVKSGWFWFGSSLWTPMLVVMVMFTLLYSVFGVLSVLYYQYVIKQSL
ncbi:ABC transporter permease [Terribacillus halophilus]|uniref:ABC transporter permease n=1 Tax=Terribacillus halophilus TaxID=361279 RepID=UPI00098431F1|nr:FtsX-like permease family protein [Terribacillus halophilus]